MPAAPLIPELARVEARLFEAILTLAAMPDRERRWFNSDRAHWPDTLREPADILEGFYARKKEGRRGFELPRLARAVPTKDAIDRMDEALGWLAALPKLDQRIIALRARDRSWDEIGWRVKMSAYLVRRAYDKALRRAASAAWVCRAA